MIKKILVMMIAVIISLTPICSYASFNDTDKDIYEKEISELQAIGIINGYKDGSFRGDNNITRGEFAKLIGDLLNINVKGATSGIIFSDVAKDHFAYSAVSFVSANKYMIGYEDNTFRPNENITGVDALRTLINVLGYSHRITNNQSVISLGNSLDLLKGAKFSLNRFITRSEVAKLFDNALTCDLSMKTGVGEDNEAIYTVKKGENILKVYHDMVKGKGVVTANSYIAIKGDIAEENSIVINDINMEYKDYFTKDKVGTKQNYVYKIDDESGKNKLIYLYPEEYKEKIISRRDFISFKDNEINYEENDKTFTIKISENADIFYNGEYVDFNNDIFKNVKDGEFRFLSSDNSSSYDVVFIKEYKNLVVNTVDLNDKVIRDKVNPSYKLDFKNPDKPGKLFDENLKEVELENVSENNIISVIEGKEYFEAYFSDKKTEGFSSYDGEKVISNDKEYYINPRANINFKNVDFNETLYLNFKNEVSYTYLNDIGGEICYLIKIGSKDKNLETTVSAKLFSKSGKLYTAPFANPFKLNDKQMKDKSLNDIETALLKDGKVEQVVLINKNDKGEISSLETAKSYAYCVENNDNSFCEVFSFAERKNLVDSNTFDNRIEYQRSGNPVMIVPEKAATADDKDFKIVSSQDIDDGDHNVAAYNIGKDYDICDLIIIKTSDTIDTELQPIYKPCAVIKSKVHAINDDGEEVIRLYIVSGSVEDYIEFSLNDDVKETHDIEEDEKKKTTFYAKDLKAGDIIRYTAKDNKLTQFMVQYIYNNDGTFTYTGNKHSDNFTRGVEMYLTKVERRTDDHLFIKFNEKNNYDYLIFPIKEDRIHKITISKDGKANVSLGNIDDIVAGENVIIQCTFNQLMSITVIKYK